MRTSASWSHRKLPHCGDHVIDVADPRHVARVDKVTWGHSVDVTWLDSGWKSLDVPLDKPNGAPRIVKVDDHA